MSKRNTRFKQAQYRNRWYPTIRAKRKMFVWIGRWKGPHGGKYTSYALTKKGLIRSCEREGARWTKKLEKKETTPETLLFPW